MMYVLNVCECMWMYAMYTYDVCECMCPWMNGWMNEQTNEWMKVTADWMDESMEI